MSSITDGIFFFITIFFALFTGISNCLSIWNSKFIAVITGLTAYPAHLCFLGSDEHYNDIIMSSMASQITSLTIVYSTIYSGTYENIKAPHHWPLCGEFTGDPHKGTVTWKMFPFDDVIMNRAIWRSNSTKYCIPYKNVSFEKARTASTTNGTAQFLNQLKKLFKSWQWNKTKLNTKAVIHINEFYQYIHAWYRKIIHYIEEDRKDVGVLK